MEYLDAALQPITVGDFIVYGSGRGEIAFGEIVRFDDLPTPQFLRGEDPRTPSRVRVRLKAHDPRRDARVPAPRAARDGSTAVGGRTGPTVSR